MDRSGLEQLQLGRLNATLQRAAHAPHYAAIFGTSAPRVSSRADLALVPCLHDKGGPARRVPLWISRGAPGRHRPHPLHLRDHRAGSSHLPHPGGHRRLGGTGGTVHVHGRGAPFGRLPEHDGLRALHRRPGFPLRGRADRRADHSRRRRQQPPPHPIDAGLPHHRGAHHPILRPLPAECFRGDGPGPAHRHQPPHRLHRRGAAFRGHAEAHRGRLRRERLQLLRADRDERPRRRLRVPESQDGMHVWEDSSSPRSSIRTTGAGCPTGKGGSWCSPRCTARAMPLLRYRTRDLTRMLPGPCPCGSDPPAHRPDQGAHRRHVHHQRGQHLPDADREDPDADPRPRRQLPHRGPGGELHGQAPRQRGDGGRGVPGHAPGSSRRCTSA